VAAIWLALGYANLVRGVEHPATAYRPWAFANHSYSDILALTGDRYLGGGRPFPYLEDRVEYPVLLGFLLWAPSFLPGGQLAHFTVSYLLLAACLFAAIAVLGRLTGASPWWLAGTPAIAYYAGLNWDLLPILLLLCSLLLAERDHVLAGGAVAALGVSAKLWPAALLPALVGALLRRGRKGLIRFGCCFASVMLAVNLPFAVLAPANWSWFFRFNAGRGAENSIWEALGVSSPRLLGAIGLAFLVAAAAVAALAAYRAGDAETACSLSPAGREGTGSVQRAVRLGVALVLVVWIATNKVWSPQYALYGFAAAAIVAAPSWMFFLLSAVAVVDYHLAFEVRAQRGIFSFFDGVYYGEEWIRTAAWVLLIAWTARELLRSRRAGAEVAST
jgi:uncharacterized membrane protein